MVSTLVLGLIVAAISIAIAAEVLVAYEKYALKKEMRAELDKRDESGSGTG
ncbi:MAG: hypothetical protein ACRECH_17245 [Nitrososphaerales archaeon]